MISDRQLIYIGFGISAAQAGVVEHVHETFASGAAFDGDVTFTNSFDNVTAVDGYLTGGVYGNDHINWIWNPGFNFGGGFPNGGNFLMDGTPGGGYTYFVTFTWDYSNAPVLTFSNGIYGNNVNYTDHATGGTITAANAVPEPATLALLGLGLLGFGVARKRKQ